MDEPKGNLYALRVIGSLGFALAGLAVTLFGVIGGAFEVRWDVYIPIGFGLMTIGSEIDPKEQVPWQMRAVMAALATLGLIF